MGWTTRCEHIDRYVAGIRSGAIPACREMHLACDWIERKLCAPGVAVDAEKTDKAIELIQRYFGMQLFPWEKFVLALIHCYDTATNTVVFSEFLVMMGRGNGKNGFISAVAWYLTTRYHGIKGYNVDLIANAEDQAKTSFDDVYQMLEDTAAKSRRFFHWTKEEIVNTDTRSYIRYNTSNARTKDGKRSACLIFDEIHEYENSETIKVFRSGFGKRPNSRIFCITTNGYVRDGVLDERLRIARDVLAGEIPQSRLCPLIYKIDAMEEAERPELWEKANPSLPWLPNLRQEMEQNLLEMRYDDDVRQDFFTKRMNWPLANPELAVADYDEIKATNKPLPDLRGCACTVGVDYAELSDWAAVNLHFRRGEARYDLNHAWICAQSKTLHRVKAPWRDWARAGHVTVVQDVSIHPDLLAGYIADAARKYNLRILAMDHHRWTLVSESLKQIGFDANDRTRVKLVRPSDIMQADPVIQECFHRGLFAWGDNPCLRWAVNNTKRVRSSRKLGVDTGNFIYAKIEAKSRKTDPFMALAASMTVEDALGSGAPAGLPRLGAMAL